jgi:putative PIN family toxin of toxin-antitoxin system
MTTSPRIVIDNNVLIGRLLIPDAIPGQAVRKAVHTGQLLVSDTTLFELAAVLARPKFDPYVTIADRQESIRLLGRVAERIPVVYRIQACRDPKDNMVLEVAVNGAADFIVTGDRDLLALGGYQGVGILTPAAYIES